MPKFFFLYLILITLINGVAFSAERSVFDTAAVQFPDAFGMEYQVGGMVGDVLLLAGGVDEQDNPSQTIYAFDVVSDFDFTLLEQTEFDKPIGSCKSAYNSSGLYITGLCGEPSTIIYKINYEQGAFEMSQLSPMPSSIIVSGLDFVGRLLYVFGFCEQQNGNILYSIDIDSAHNQWIEISGFPGKPVYDAIVTANYGMLHIFGGELVYEKEPTTACYGWRERPVDGTSLRGWIELKSMPKPTSKATPFVTGQSHTAVAGGYRNGEIYDGVLVYHSITDTWFEANKLPQPAIFASAVSIGRDTFLTGGKDGRLLSITTSRIISRLKFIDYFAIFGYFAVLAAIGTFFAFGNKDAEGFAVGNRKVKWWAAGISMFATGASSISFMAIPTQVYRTNLIWLTPMFVFIAFYFVQAYWLFPLLRGLRIISTYEYLQRRFSPALRTIGSIQSIAFQTFGRMSIVMLLPALAISAVTGMNVYMSVLLMGLLTTLYSAAGGFNAVIWTDVVQGVLMFGGALIMIYFAISGLPGGVNQFVEVGTEYGKFDLYLSGWDISMPILFLLIMQSLTGLFAQTADQTMIQRVFSIPLKDCRKIAATFVVCGVLIAIAVQFMGLSIFAYFNANPSQLDPAMANDQVVPLFIVQVLPAGAAGLIIAGLFAASMSTLSSSMNSVALLVSEDFYCKIIPQASQKARLFVMRTATLAVGIFSTATALFMASKDIQSMWQIWIELAALLGGGFAGMFFLGIFSTRANSIGAIAGAVASILCTIYIKNATTLHWSAYAATAVLTCIIVGYLASLIFPSKTKYAAGLTIYEMTKKVH